MKKAYEVALGMLEAIPDEPEKDQMIIQLNTPLLLGLRNYAKGDIVDLEITGEKKKELVEKGLAHYYEPPKPKAPETASLKVPSTATKHKGKAN